MTSPFGLWLDLWESGMKAASSGLRLAETAHASREVIEHRSKAMSAAMHDPLNADYRELGRMIPEKVEAFSRAGFSAVSDLASIQASLHANWSHAMSIMLSGRMPTMADTSAMTARSSAALNRSVNLAGKALAPVHRTATGNARRLRSSKKRA